MPGDKIHVFRFWHRLQNFFGLWKQGLVLLVIDQILRKLWEGKYPLLQNFENFIAEMRSVACSKMYDALKNFTHVIDL